jgi:hypothetical protein
LLTSAVLLTATAYANTIKRDLFMNTDSVNSQYAVVYVPTVTLISIPAVVKNDLIKAFYMEVPD